MIWPDEQRNGWWNKRIQMKIHNSYPFLIFLASTFIVLFFSFGVFLPFIHFHSHGHAVCVFSYLTAGLLLVFISNDHIFVQNTAFKSKKKLIPFFSCFVRMNKIRIKYIVQKNIKCVCFIFSYVFFALLVYSAGANLYTITIHTCRFSFEFITSFVSLLLFRFTCCSCHVQTRAHPLVCVEPIFRWHITDAAVLCHSIRVAVCRCRWKFHMICSMFGNTNTNRDAGFVCFNSSHSVQ